MKPRGKYRSNQGQTHLCGFPSLRFQGLPRPLVTRGSSFERVDALETRTRGCGSILRCISDPLSKDRRSYDDAIDGAAVPSFEAVETNGSQTSDRMYFWPPLRNLYPRQSVQEDIPEVSQINSGPGSHHGIARPGLGRDAAVL